MLEHREKESERKGSEYSTYTRMALHTCSREAILLLFGVCVRVCVKEKERENESGKERETQGKTQEIAPTK